MADDSGNGQLLARIDERTQAMDARLGEILARLEAFDKRMRDVETAQVRMTSIGGVILFLSTFVLNPIIDFILSPFHTPGTKP